MSGFKIPIDDATCQRLIAEPQIGRGSAFAHQFQRGMLVSLGLDQHIEDLALSVDGPPKVDHSAVDFQIDLVEMPSRMRLRDGTVTLPCEERERSTPYGFSSRRDGLAPRGHRRGA